MIYAGGEREAGADDDDQKPSGLVYGGVSLPHTRLSRPRGPAPPNP